MSKMTISMNKLAPLKITFLVPVADHSGGARVVSIYAEEMIRRGHRVKLVIAGYRSLTIKARLRAWITGSAPLFSIRKSAESHYSRLQAITAYASNPGIITDVDCPEADIVIATWWETAEWMMSLSASKGAKIHFVQHYEAFIPEWRNRVDAVLREPTKKITISKWLNDLLTERFSNNNVSLVRNAVDHRQFYAPLRSKNKVLTVGMLYSDVEWKNCKLGFDAFNILRTKHPDARLITFGAVPVSKELPLVNGADFFLRPDQDQIKDIYSRCDVWLCPSKAEGFHLPPLEAMACRCPVVSTAVGGSIDIIEQGINGYIVENASAPELANNVARVIEQSDADWLAMSTAAFNTAQSYNWTIAADAFEQALFTQVEQRQK